MALRVEGLGSCALGLGFRAGGVGFHHFELNKTFCCGIRFSVRQSNDLRGLLVLVCCFSLQVGHGFLF